MALYTSRDDFGLRLIRRFTALFVCCLALFLTGVWLLSAPEPLAGTRFAPSSCQVVTVVDETGRALVGIEDLQQRADTGMLVISAYDRRNPEVPLGGLYTVSLFALSGGSRVPARTLYDGETAETRFRPHGFSLSPDGTRLAVVIRGDENDAWIETGPTDGKAWAPERRITGTRLCRANDVQLAGNDSDDMLITLDRAECEASFGDLLPGAQTGRVARFDGTSLSILSEGLAFPNGVAAGHVAETRAAHIRVPGDLPIEVPGGPDNLSEDGQGRLIAALHPSLFQLWIYREGWRARSPSRIVRVDPAARTVEPLFDDPEGLMFSGATGAVVTDNILVAGSALDAGLLVCRAGP